LIISPPVANININGHVYTNAQLQSNPAGWIAGIANDVGSITSLYPTGRFAPRIPLTSDLTFFVDPSAGSDLNTGLIGSPVQTIQRAFDILRDKYDLAGWTVTVQLANGVYSDGLKLRGRLVGQQSPASLILKGNSASPSSVTISDTTVPTGFFERGDGVAVYANWGALLTVDGCRLVGGHRDLWANTHSEIRILNIVFSNSGTTDTHLAASHGAIVRVRGNYTVNGNCSRSHCLATDHGSVMLSDTGDPELNPTITFSGTPSVGITLETQRMGMILTQSSQTTFSGSVTGKKFQLDTLGLLWTNGSGGTMYIPGDQGGTAINGAIFN
jgi:hypothetical protein